MILKEKIEILRQSFEERIEAEQGPLFTRYQDSGSKVSPGPDSFWLEETRKGAVPFANRDEDGDGFHEVSQVSLEFMMEKGLVKGTFRLASYFDDRKYSFPIDLEAFKIFTNDPDPSFKEIQALADQKDLQGAASFFKSLAKGEENPLFKLRPFLRVFLGNIAIHSGFGVDDRVTLENNPNGFSVAADGRWRVDCVIFAQMAQAALKEVEGLEFSYVFLRAEKPRMAHVVMLVSDGVGRHLLIDNERAIYFEAKNPEEFLIQRYTKQGYETMARGGEEWNPFQKAKKLYPTDSKQRDRSVTVSDIRDLLESQRLTY